MAKFRPSLTVTLHLPNHDTRQLLCQKSDTVSKLQEMIFDTCGVMAEQQKIFLGAFKELRRADATLEECGVADGDSLFLRLRDPEEEQRQQQREKERERQRMAESQEGSSSSS